MEPKQKWTCWKEDGDLQMWACGNGESSYGVWFSDEQQAQAMCDELNNVERLRAQVEAMRVAGEDMRHWSERTYEEAARVACGYPVLEPLNSATESLKKRIYAWTASLNPPPKTPPNDEH